MNYHHSALTLTLTVFLAFLRLTSSSDDDHGGAILVLGDSWASLSGSFLANVCSLGKDEHDHEHEHEDEPRDLTNDGKSGSTAEQWASGNLAVGSFTKAKYDYDYVWLSIGGNDFKCDESIHDDIADDIIQVLTDIFDSSTNDDMKLLFTGYGYPSEDLCQSSTLTTALFDSLSSTIRSAIEQSSYADRVVTMDISSLFVTNDSSPLSDKMWYADDIHINEAGYIKLFSLDTVQDFFGCTASHADDGNDNDNGNGPSSSSSVPGPAKLMHVLVPFALFILSVYF